MTMDHANDTDPAVFAAVLTELKQEARTPAKEVIEVYDPSLNYEENLNNLEAIPASNLEATAIFLGQEVRCVTSGVQKYHSVTALAIIMRIEGFGPQTCSECAETYSVKMNESPSPLLGVISVVVVCTTVQRYLQRPIALLPRAEFGCAPLASGSKHWKGLRATSRTVVQILV